MLPVLTFAAGGTGTAAPTASAATAAAAAGGAIFPWASLLPELAVAGLALLALALELTLPASLRKGIPALVGTALGALALWVALAAFPAGGTAAGAGAGATDALNTAPPVADAAPLFSGMLAQTAANVVTGSVLSTSLARLFFLLAALCVTWLGTAWLRRRTLPETEFLCVVLVVTAALMLLVQSANFVLFYVALETVGIGFCALAGYNRDSGASLESGVKYLVQAGVSGALLLFGITLLYGTAGNPALNPAAGAAGSAGFDAFSFAALQPFIAANAANPLVLAGAALVTAGVAFKIGLFPFQSWLPDVYQGAPTPVTAFLGVASKGAGVLALFVLLGGPFSALATGGGVLHTLLACMAGATLLFANITALGQANTKRLMALSGISHAGFLTLAVLAATAPATTAGAAGSASVPFPFVTGAAALYVYLAAYFAGSFTVFGVMNELPPAGVNEDADAAQNTSDYQLLRERSPFLAWVLALGLGSLAGVPPTWGFVAKFVVIAAAFQAGLWWLGALALLCVAPGIYYYFAWLREAFQRFWLPAERHAELLALRPRPSPVARLLLLALGVVILFGGIGQRFVSAFF
ncbi:MAG: NADH-quinone oxidoreductase subunit N [Puniceicoccales bacterium]|jgi:NADH-quinone oxidoreductase subunit N|nr:NADH-quinone oxidoreductase subunit N [Puniceicoccales bacterium]